MVSWMMTIKAVLISCGVASVGVLFKVSVPVVVDFFLSMAPVMWSYWLSWLKPPYLYVVTNGIVIVIVASSKFYRRHDWGDDYEFQTEPPIVQQAPDSRFGFGKLESEVVTAVEFEDYEEKVTEDEDEVEEEVKSVTMADDSDLVEFGLKLAPIVRQAPLRMNPDSNFGLEPESEVFTAVVVEDDEDEIEDEVKSVIMVENSENKPPAEKPLVSSRRRKSVTSNPEGGRALRATKPEELNETLENIWKMITEGKSTSLTKQVYRRSETFNRGDSGQAKPEPVYKKSETFRDRTNYYNMRKEPSLSQDELNRRAEEFIKKFNEEMKMQRMESLRQNRKVTGHGV